MRIAVIASIAFIFAIVFAGVSHAFYFSSFGGNPGYGFTGYSYSNYGYGYSSNAYYPASYRSGYYSNPFGAYYGSGSYFGYPRSSLSFFFRSW